jgi:hypothetical protein
LYQCPQKRDVARTRFSRNAHAVFAQRHVFEDTGTILSWSTETCRSTACAFLCCKDMISPRCPFFGSKTQHFVPFSVNSNKTHTQSKTRRCIPSHNTQDHTLHTMTQSPDRPPMSAIQEHLSSFLAFPSALLGAIQDTQDATNKPAREHPSQGSCLPPMPPSRPAPNHPVQHLQAPTSPVRRAASQLSSCSSSPCSSKKRVSWADEYYIMQDPKPRTQAQRMVEREHPLSVRLEGFEAAKRTALAHVDRARKATASNTLHADSHHESRASPDERVSVPLPMPSDGLCSFRASAGIGGGRAAHSEARMPAGAPAGGARAVSGAGAGSWGGTRKDPRKFLF